MFLAHSLEVAEHSKESAVCRSGAPRSVTSSRLDDVAHLSSLWCDNLELKGEHKEMIGNLTWCVPHVELDPLLLNLEASRVILKHRGNVILKREACGG